MKKDHRLLVCIPFHYHDLGMAHLSVVLYEFMTQYKRKLNLHIIVDTNCEQGKKVILDLYPNMDVRVHPNLAHPFHLTWIHRGHIQSHLDQYDVFMYVEYDMLLPYANYCEHLKNLELLWEQDVVPALFRVELNYTHTTLYSTDAEQPVVYNASDNQHIVRIGDKIFTRNLPHPLPYHAMWVATRDMLTQIIPPNFCRFETSRERAASFLIWEMDKIGHVEMGPDGHVSPRSLVYHLPGNYTNDPTQRLGKITAEDALRIAL